MKFNRSNGGILTPAHALLVGGTFRVEQYRAGKLIDLDETPNIVVNEGLTHVLNTVFRGGTQIGTWYLGIFEGNYTPIATVTASTIAAAATESTAYSETTRPEYSEGAVSGQSVSNGAARATFTINADKTIFGAFLVSTATKGGTSGVLMSAARFSSAKSLAAEDQLLLTYTFNASSV